MDNGYDVSSFAANSDAQTALTSGKVDAWVIDDLTAADMVKVYNAAGGDQLVILDEAMTTEPYAFAFAFGSEDLVAEINTILNGLVADGTTYVSETRHIKRGYERFVEKLCSVGAAVEHIDMPAPDEE